MRTQSRPHHLVLSAMLGATIGLAPLQAARACSRAVYFGLEEQTVTGRTMD